MKFLQLLVMLVLSSFIFTQNAPGDGAFSTFHVKAENPTEYANYLKENSQLLGNQNPVAAGTCITRSGSRYTGEMFVWQAFTSMEEAMENTTAYDPYSAPFALKQMRTPLYSSFWKPLKSFNIRPKSFERVNRVIVQPENLLEYIQVATMFEQELQKSNPGFVMGIFQPLGGGAEEAVANQYMVRGLTDTPGEHGKFADDFFAGNVTWAAMYQKLLSLGTIIDDSYDECEILYTAE